ncbi:GNAT family N-acetyltransferase [Caulobacter segnis]|uniref:GNAT family N-acetyltransferase n=1 Tax=Caulobacter segnis TaxID=88688 RepID=UPI001CBE53CF|nr:GNAT family N-acetyltransferase [Caulobacter segnis]UAL09008.1 GNAT family N-acetyltransferase [Caulobacter segnis]
MIDPALLEPLADDAWPARERERLGGWRLNASSGRSMRINACWPLAAPDRDPEAALDAVEAWFAARGLPPRFKLTDGLTAPVDLAQRLAARGYASGKETVVMLGPLEALVRGEGDPAIRVTASPDAAFGAVFTATAGDPEDGRERLEALGRIPAPARFARLDIDGAPAAIGCAAIGGPFVGVFGMRTAPDHRRKGLARRVLRALLAEAKDLGAERAWLQVEAENAPAIALYADEGFEPGYRYRYWER